MNTDTIFSLVQATIGTASEMISQIAWFFAIGAAAKWLSVSFPLLMLFSVFLKTRKTITDETKRGSVTLATWILLAVTIYTATNGVAHLLQAATAPSIYVADQFGIISDLWKGKP